MKLANNKFIEIESWQLEHQEEFKNLILFQNQRDKENQDKIEELNCKSISCEEQLLVKKVYILRVYMSQEFLIASSSQISWIKQTY